MINKSQYKVIDSRGRVYIPKEIRTAMEINYGDIVKLTLHNGVININKVELIEVGDKSPEAVESFINASIKFMAREKKIELINKLSLALKEN